MSDMTPIERRVLAHIEELGGHAYRDVIVCDLANPDSNIGRGFVNGSNGGIPRIFGRWTKRLKTEGLLREHRGERGAYRGHSITDAGRAALRALPFEPEPEDAS